MQRTSTVKPNAYLIFLHLLHREAPPCTRDCRFGSARWEGGTPPGSCCGHRASLSVVRARGGLRVPDNPKE